MSTSSDRLRWSRFNNTYLSFSHKFNCAGTSRCADISTNVEPAWHFSERSSHAMSETRNGGYHANLDVLGSARRVPLR